MTTEIPSSARIVFPDLDRLKDFFPADDIEWKPGAVTRDKSKGLAMAYVTARAIQDRLDDVCGVGNWRNEFQRWGSKGVLCGLSIRVTYADGSSAWVTKWNGADESDIESTKGGLSNAEKRVASEWGIGRYLYSLPSVWVRLDDRGRFAEPPRIPREFLPARQASEDARPSPGARRSERPQDARKSSGRPQGRPDGRTKPSGQRARQAKPKDDGPPPSDFDLSLAKLKEALKRNGWKAGALREMLADSFAADSIEDLSPVQTHEAIGIARQASLRDRYQARAESAASERADAGAPQA